MERDAATLGRRWFEEVWNARNDKAIDELMAPDAVFYVEGGEVHGPEGFRAIRKMFLDALPDAHIEVEDVLSQDNQSVVRWRVTATHGGELFGIPATGARIDIRGMSWAVVRDGMLVEGFDTWNIGGLAETLRIASETKG